MRNRSPQALWETALGQLELQVTRPNFETWLRHTVGLRLGQDTLVVGVPSDFTLEWLRTRMSPLVNRTVSRLLDGELSVAFEVLGAQPADDRRAEAPASNGDGGGHARPADLDARLTFDGFVVLKANRLAYRAAQKAATGEGEYNPLVLLGTPGTGKTHLLHAIGNAAATTHRPVSIMTGEGFVDRYGRAVRTGQPHTFRQEFDACSVFLLDDFSFLHTRAASLEQFFHLFNALTLRGCTVVITCDQHPKDADALPPRLRSRIQGGLVAELHAPSADERLELLRKKVAVLKAALPEAVLELIAGMPYETITELEGGLNQVLAFARLSGKELSPDVAKQALYPLRSTPRQPSPQQIINAVCDHFHISTEQITGPSRARDITYPRHLAIYLMRRFGPHPLTDIGRLLGGRDHSTVISAYRKIEREAKSLAETQADIKHIEARLRSDSVA